LTEDPEHPSGAHWFWTRVIPEMAKRLESGEELYLLVSPKSRVYHQGYGPGVRYITFPWSNEHRNLRTLSEQLYSPVRLPLSRIDVFNTLMAPTVSPFQLDCGGVRHGLVKVRRVAAEYKEAPVSELVHQDSLHHDGAGRGARTCLIRGRWLQFWLHWPVKRDEKRPGNLGSRAVLPGSGGRI
jgi:hypothetical protein